MPDLLASLPFGYAHWKIGALVWGDGQESDISDQTIQAPTPFASPAMALAWSTVLVVTALQLTSYLDVLQTDQYVIAADEACKRFQIDGRR